MDEAHVASVRRFNRFVTQRAGALEDRFLGRDRPLGHSRVLYEIGAAGADLRELRARLGLDSGYLSRIAQSLETQGLIDVTSDAQDERVRHARLTRKGRSELAEMNRRSDLAAVEMLAPLSGTQRDRLVTAMDTVCALLRAAAATISREDPASATARRCVARYFAELATRFDDGFDPALSIAADDRELRPPSGAFLVAMVDGDALACGAVKRLTSTRASIKRMWVSPLARGVGLGRRMLAALEAEARSMGMRTVCLETNRALEEAQRLYRACGYVEVAAFNDDPYAHHWFEKRLA